MFVGILIVGFLGKDKNMCLCTADISQQLTCLGSLRSYRNKDTGEKHLIQDRKHWHFLFYAIIVQKHIFIPRINHWHNIRSYI